jgi:hypothetical protein
VTAAELGVNLVANPNFENVDLTVTGEDNGPRILGWTGRNAFAFSHDGSSTSAGIVPDFAQGANPPNAGHWYFTPTQTGSGTDITGRNEFYQDIDVSTGATNTEIAADRASYHLSAYLSSRANDDGRPWVDLQFFDANGGRTDQDAIIIPGDDGPRDLWQLVTLSQEIQPTVTRIRISLFGERQTGGPNGYVDNIVLSISSTIPEPSASTLAVLVLIIAGLDSCRRRRDSFGNKIA